MVLRLGALESLRPGHGQLVDTSIDNYHHWDVLANSRLIAAALIATWLAGPVALCTG